MGWPSLLLVGPADRRWFHDTGVGLVQDCCPRTNPLERLVQRLQVLVGSDEFAFRGFQVINA